MSSYATTIVETYEEMLGYADQFARDDGFRFLIVLGGAGVGKSYMFRERLRGTNVACFQGAMSPIMFFKRLHDHLDEPVVIDDVDSLFADRAAVNLLKCVCQTDEYKVVNWDKASAMLAKEGVPTTFSTKSRVCILANKIPAGDANLTAVLDRATVVTFYPNIAEVHRHAGTWFNAKDAEIYEFFGANLERIAHPSFRLYEKALEQRRLGRDWKHWLEQQWISATDKTALIARVMADRGLTDNEERAARFAELGGGSRPTFQRWLNKWKQAQGFVGRLPRKKNTLRLVQDEATTTPAPQRAAIIA